MIVRERQDSFVLVEQHEHALISGEFARNWGKPLLPLDSTRYAISYHDVAWRGLDAMPLWNEENGKPYSFVDYPSGLKLPAQKLALDLVEAHDPYAACLCSMHYARFLLNSEKSTEVEFLESELDRQCRLRANMTGEELENLEYNLQFLRLCDGLSLFLCLNEPGDTDQPPPYPEGFVLDETRFETFWEDAATLRLEPNPFSWSFEVEVPYLEVSRDREILESNALKFRVVC